MKHVLKMHEWLTAMMSETDPQSWPEANEIYELLTEAMGKDFSEMQFPEVEKPKYFKENLLELLSIKDKPIAET